MLAGLGRSMYVRRRLVVAGWLVVAVAGAVFGGSVYDRTQSIESLPAGAPAAVAQDRLDAVAPEGERVVAVISGRDVGATGLIESVTRTAFELRALPGVAEVEDSYTTGRRQFSTDNRSSLISVELRPGLSDDEASRVADEVSAALRRIDAPEILVGGELLAEREFEEQAVRDAAVGESVALVCVGILLVLLLGGLVAGLLPLLAALGAVAATLLTLTGLAGLLPVSEYAVNVVTLLGIGLAVDYSLLMIARFREERAADPRARLVALIERTVVGAGRAVLVSGSAVAAALAGLFAFGDPLLGAMAMGGALVVALATAAGLTLVPALLGIAHRRIPARVEKRRGPGFLVRLAAFAQRRPGAVALTTADGFVFAFGLSMDYEVFLLARIKEEWDRRTATDGAANDRAVLAGITAAGPVVTTAALAIGLVFLGFVLGDLVAVKEIGVGMAVAVLLDVTVVRGLLLPATMSLLGRWNWWRPGPGRSRGRDDRSLVVEGAP